MVVAGLQRYRIEVLGSGRALQSSHPRQRSVDASRAAEAALVEIDDVLLSTPYRLLPQPPLHRHVGQSRVDAMPAVLPMHPALAPACDE